MKVSRDKPGTVGTTVAQASGAKLRKGVTPGLLRMGIKVKKKVRNLGVDFGAGGKACRKVRLVLAGRPKESSRRIKRVVVSGGTWGVDASRCVALPATDLAPPFAW